MTREEQTDPHLYRIGAVSRLTSIPTGTIRVWERRYGVVAPGRSDGGFRLYSHRDVERLRVIKSLIESGETISGLADLDLGQLRQRLKAHGITEPEPLQHPLALDAAAAAAGPTNGAVSAAGQPTLITNGINGTARLNGLSALVPPTKTSTPLRVVAAGEGLAVAMRVASTTFDDLVLVGTRPDWRGQERELSELKPDLLVVEQSSIHIETADELRDLVRSSGAKHSLVVYQFGSEAALRAIESSRIVPLKGPLSPTQLQLALRLATDRGEPPESPEQSRRFIEDSDRPPPPPRFDPATMARISAQSKVVHCECPQHLATLISSLMAFESYCRECENRSEEDAALHATLERATGQARAKLEDALDYLLQVENIVF
ncbi:MAG: MerR family transcriptional regulator [Myxococcota bacterium]